jgi:hypothetical protein
VAAGAIESACSPCGCSPNRSHRRTPARLRTPCGSLRIVTHRTEDDNSAQHTSTAREPGADVSDFLMRSHLADAAQLAAQVKLIERLCRTMCLRLRLQRPADHGWDTPAAGLDPRTQSSVHAHENLTQSVELGTSKVPYSPGRFKRSWSFNDAAVQRYRAKERIEAESAARCPGGLPLTPASGQPDRSDDLEGAIHLSAVGAVDVLLIDGIGGHLREDRR